METISSSVSLTQDLEEKVKALAKARGQTKNGLIQEALRQYVLRQELEPIEKKMQARARAIGIESDEDVVALVHETRRRKVAR